jgi:hypothetical protein
MQQSIRAGPIPDERRLEPACGGRERLAEMSRIVFSLRHRLLVRGGRPE